MISTHDRHASDPAPPPLADAIARVVEHVECQIGANADDIPPGVPSCDWLRLQRFAEACGDENPLYIDPAYGAGTWWQTTIAPPAFILAVRTPEHLGLPEGPLGAAGYNGRLVAMELSWDDHIRLGDRVAGHVQVRGARVQQDGATVLVDSTATYTRMGTPFATAHGTVAVRPPTESASTDERDIECYDDAATAALVGALEAEPARRGAVPRQWEDIQVGDLLPSHTKGPLTWSDIVSWIIAEGRAVKAANLRAREVIEQARPTSIHPVTNWPVWDRADLREDHDARASTGLGAPVARPALAVALCGQVVAEWMGDDGFLRFLRIELHAPFRYGDAWQIGGQVRHKFLQRHANRTYHGVALTLRAVDQRGAHVADGFALVFLPSVTGPVQVPIPGPTSST